MMKIVDEINKFGVKINPLTISEFIEFIENNLLTKEQLIQQTSINAYTIVSIQSDLDLRKAINKSSLVNIDGMSVVWALRFLGHKNVTKASCPDIFDKLIELSVEKGYRPYFLGSKPEVIERAIQKLKNTSPTLQIAGYHHGYFNEEEAVDIVKMIKESRADMLFLGISSPKKELFSDKYMDIMQVPYTFGVGGVFDILAGITQRAPLWMQQSGLEWLYRFLQEPSRMWKRYLVGNTKFIWIVIKEKFKQLIY